MREGGFKVEGSWVQDIRTWGGEGGIGGEREREKRRDETRPDGWEDGQRTDQEWSNRGGKAKTRITAYDRYYYHS
jgi:hypothetical protein